MSVSCMCLCNVLCSMSFGRRRFQKPYMEDHTFVRKRYRALNKVDMEERTRACIDRHGHKTGYGCIDYYKAGEGALADKCCSHLLEHGKNKTTSLD